MVALVVTIIVLLILAGISLKLISGSNGILSRTTRAAKLTEIARFTDSKELSDGAVYVDMYDKETGYAVADIMTRVGEEINIDDLIIVSPTDYLKRKRIIDFTIVPLQQTIFEEGKLVFDDPDLDTTKAYCEAQMATIYPEVKRTNNPQEYHVSGTEEYVNFKNNLIEEHRALALK